MMEIVRNRLARAKSILGFRDGSPPSDPAAVLLFDQLKGLYDQGLERAGVNAEHANEARELTSRARDLRRHLQGGLLRLISRAGRSAARATPALAPEFAPVIFDGSAVSFGTTARLLLDTARRHAEQLGQFGVTPGLIDEADALLKEFEDVSARAVAARNGRVGAGAQLEVVSGAIMDVIGRLDGLFRHRLASKPGELAAWLNAVTAAGPIKARSKPAPPSGAANPTPGAAAA